MPAISRKTVPLPVKQPLASDEDEDDSPSSEKSSSSSDDALDTGEDPIAPVFFGFGCPIVEEPYHKL